MHLYRTYSSAVLMSKHDITTILTYGIMSLVISSDILFITIHAYKASLLASTYISTAIAYRTWRII